LRGTEEKNIIENRVKQARWEIKQSKYYDYCIVNDNLKKARDKLKKLLLEKIHENEK
jgi:guanylate kinase